MSDIIAEEITTEDEFIEEIIIDKDGDLNEDLSIKRVQSEISNDDAGNKVVSGLEVEEDRKHDAGHMKSLRQDMDDGADFYKYLNKDSEELFDSNYDGETDISSTNKTLGDNRIVTEVSKFENRVEVESRCPNEIPIAIDNDDNIQNIVEKLFPKDPQIRHTGLDVTENLDLQLVDQTTIATDGSKYYGPDSYNQPINDGAYADISEENAIRSDRLGEEAESFVEGSLETGRESQGLGGLADDEDSELDPTEYPRDVDSYTHASFQSESREDNIDEDDGDRTEMSLSEMRAMYNAVKAGNIDWLEDCLDKRCSDINMTWYSENLLMAAIRAGQQEMAEFLLDNGVDYNYVTSVIEVQEIKGKKRLDVYSLTCRQLARDCGLLDIAEIIDEKNGDLFNFVKPRKRLIRLRRPKPPTPIPSPHEKGGTLEGGDEENSINNKSILNPEPKSINSKHKEFVQKNDEESDSVLNTDNKETIPEQGRISLSVTNSYTGLTSVTKRRNVLDEGYETMSPKSSPRCSSINRTGACENACVRGNKASILLLGYTRNRLPKINHQSIPEETRLTDKKVETVGSYAWESKFWHRKVPKQIPTDNDFVKITPDRVKRNNPWHSVKNEGVNQYETSDNFQNGPVRKFVHKQTLHKSKSSRTGYFIQQSYSMKRGSLPDIVRISCKGNDDINNTSVIPKTSYSADARGTSSNKTKLF